MTADSTSGGPRRPTLRDVAERADVSMMSASRALRGDRGVSDGLRERVLRAAEELGYRRNESARQLRLGSGSNLVGVIVTHLSNPFYARLTLGVQQVMQARGMEVVLGNTEEDPGRERELIGNLIERDVDGIVLVPSGYRHEHLEGLLARGTPVVLASRPATGHDLDCVLVDDFDGARQATRHLSEAGHERIAFVGNPPAVYTGAERYRGYCAALEEGGLPLRDAYVDRGCADATTAEHAVSRMLRSSSPPTAVFTSSNRLALGALRALGDGREIGFATFDELEYASLLDRAVTMVSYDAEEIGRRAGDLLGQRLDERASTREPRPAARSLVPVSLRSNRPAHRVG